MKTVVSILPVIVASLLVHAIDAQSLVTPCDLAYYDKLIHVDEAGYLQGKPQSPEYKFVSQSGVSVKTVTCKKLSETATLVTITLANPNGDIGIIESGVDYVPTHITTQAELDNKQRAKEHYLATTIAPLESKLQGRIGTSLVFSSKEGGITPGVPLRVTAISYLREGEMWHLTVHGPTSEVGASFDSAQKLTDYLDSAYTLSQFQRLSLADRKAIRNHTWEYGMSEEVLFQIWGYPTHQNDYDGEKQDVYVYGSSDSIFYFDRRGRLTNHQSHD